MPQLWRRIFVCLDVFQLPRFIRNQYSILFVVFLCVTIVSRAEDKHKEKDYSLGRSRLWSYQRVYPFLAGEKL